MIISHCLDGGIFDKMWYDAARDGRKIGSSGTDENENPPSLEMKHLSPSFAIWGIMILMSAMSFLMEMSSSLCLPQKSDNNKKCKQNKVVKIRTLRTSRRVMGHTHCGIMIVASLTIASTLGQNIYEGCGNEKSCLGFEKGLDDVQTSCLRTQVIDISKIKLHLKCSTVMFLGLLHSCGISTIRDEGLC